MRIGLSLSFCVRDIAAGIVAEEDVVQIITGTCADTEERWDDLIGMYSRLYWNEFPEQACDIAARLMRAGKIDQPRTRGEAPPNIAQRRWVEAEEEAE